ncbi:Sterol-sensing domain and Patched family-containing protein [Strongyloides ratti]|uniref:Sterol-sensing domain and Patched family-containing protein n=1 Tax=Strongyloides ratti TaxID=34506 RepID=A0A090LI78_STRRB|nr:Sterol-sensing domain and Patched family-containing protein [Strongyloides ratti]CEF67843.1 Sterol-sensing domain and Patched family-containing protein [Strongyloides ratti]
MEVLIKSNNQLIVKFVTKYPIKCIIFSLIITFILSISLLNAKVERDIVKSFSSSNSKADIELMRYLEFYGFKDVPKRAFLLIQAKDGGNMLRSNILKSVLKIDERITKVIEKKVIDKEDTVNLDNQKSISNTNVNYQEKKISLCHPLCNLNQPFHLFLKSLIPVLEGKNKKNKTQYDINENTLTYPHFKIMGNDIFIGLNLFGVLTSNHIFQNNRSNIQFVETIILWYVSRSDINYKTNDFQNITLQLFEESTLHKNSKINSDVVYEIYGDEIANYEMVRGAIEATILMIIGFILLIGFVTFIFYTQINPKRYVIYLVIGAIASPFLSALSSFGLLVWLGYDLYVIMCVTPFMILAIGVDDAFILTNSFVKLSHLKDQNVRIFKALSAVGPSIAITSITNTVAFGIGFFTPTRQMSLFCLCISIAVMIDYIFTFTLFLPILVLTSKKQDENQKIQEKNKMELNFIKKYVNLLFSYKGKLILIILMIVIYIISSYHILNMRQTFIPSKAFPSDSHLVTSLESIRKVFDSHFPVSIFFSNPPNITNTNEYENFYQMINKIENLNETYGRNKSLILLDKYEDFDRKTHKMFNYFGIVNNNYSLTLDNMKYFITNILKTERLKYDEKNKKLLKLHITIMAKNMSEWSKRAKYYEKIRNILEEYSEFNGTIFDADSGVLDMILNVKNDLIGSITVSIISMGIICLLFIPNFMGVVLIVITLTSICYNLVGFLAWWGSDLDIITIVDVLIASGLSVDYTAHFAHIYFASKGSYKERLTNTLSEISLPMINAGLSTFLCMFPLIFIQTYSILAFAKTIFIVVGLGLVHGLFVLPIILILVPLNDEFTVNFENDTSDQDNINVTSIQPFITK